MRGAVRGAMSTSLGLSPDIVRYLSQVNPPEHPALKRCREETASMPMARMQISAEQGAFMSVIARMIRAKRAFEVGVFTGYSALATALALKDMHATGAHLLACDLNEEWTTRARGYWRDAQADDVIELVLAPAAETLDARIAAGETGQYDLGFIDADKTGYDAYYERGLTLLREGGVMLFDNMLWGGKVADSADTTPDTTALRSLAAKARSDARVHAAMTSIGDGVLIVVKR
jgi:predicted O-methyltransferase YrrM